MKNSQKISTLMSTHASIDWQRFFSSIMKSFLTLLTLTNLFRNCPIGIDLFCIPPDVIVDVDVTGGRNGTEGGGGGGGIVGCGTGFGDGRQFDDNEDCKISIHVFNLIALLCCSVHMCSEL